MTDPKLHELLDQTKFGDQLTLAHSNGKHTIHVSGPVLADQSQEPSVGIDLLDGDPHIVRTPTGVIWAPVVQAVLRRGGRLIAKWEAVADHLEAQQAPPQSATAPPEAQQGNSGHGDGGEAVQAAMAVLCDEGADSEGGWHSWRCFDGTVWAADGSLSDPRDPAGFDRWLAAHDAEVHAQALAPIREALAGHPRCDIHPDGDPITCGWKHAVASVQAALDKENR